MLAGGLRRATARRAAPSAAARVGSPRGFSRLVAAQVAAPAGRAFPPLRRQRDPPSLRLDCDLFSKCQRARRRLARRPPRSSAPSAGRRGAGRAGARARRCCSPSSRFFVWVNFAVARRAPARMLLKSFFGIETVFTRVLAGPAQSHFFRRDFAATYLCFDPIRKAVLVLRCFHGRSLAPARISRVELKRCAARAARALRAALLACSAALHAARCRPRCGSRRRPRVESTELNARSTKCSSAANTPGALPREKRGREADGQMSWLDEHGFAGPRANAKQRVTADGSVRSRSSCARSATGSSSGKPAIPASGGGSSTGSTRARALLVVAHRRCRSRSPCSSPAAGAIPAPDVAAPSRRRRARSDEENVTADQLPEDGWLQLARELIERGELRLALRASYLAGLAHLGQPRTDPPRPAQIESRLRPRTAPPRARAGRLARRLRPQPRRLRARLVRRASRSPPEALGEFSAKPRTHPRMLRKPLLTLTLALLLAAGFLLGHRAAFRAALRSPATSIRPTPRCAPIRSARRRSSTRSTNCRASRCAAISSRCRSSSPAQPITLVYAGVPHESCWTEREVAGVRDARARRLARRLRLLARRPRARARRGETRGRERARKETQASGRAAEKRRGRRRERTPPEKADGGRARETRGWSHSTRWRSAWISVRLSCPTTSEKAHDRHAVLVDAGGDLERELSWHSALYFKDLSPEWKPLYTVRNQAGRHRAQLRPRQHRARVGFLLPEQRSAAPGAASAAARAALQRAAAARLRRGTSRRRPSSRASRSSP